MKSLSSKFQSIFYLISIFYIITGVLGILHPMMFSVYLIFILGAFFLINGGANFIDGVLNLRKEDYHWGMSLFLGIIEIFLALSMFFNPISSQISIVIYVGALLLVRGLFIIFNSLGINIELKKHQMSIGIISTLFGILFIVIPFFSQELIVLMVAWFILFSGVNLFVATLSFKKILNN